MEQDLELEALMLRDRALNETKDRRDGAKPAEPRRPTAPTDDTLLTGAGAVSSYWRRPAT